MAIQLDKMRAIKAAKTKIVPNLLQLNSLQLDKVLPNKALPLDHCRNALVLSEEIIP
jgi:hypothetical protein